MSLAAAVKAIITMVGGLVTRVIAIFAFLWTAGLQGDDPLQDGYHARAEIIQAARQEGHLVVYNTMHADAALADILATFHRRYPFITIRDSDGDALKTYIRFTGETARHRPSADLIWSMAMDLQEKLINDGFALAYTSPEMPALPNWAHWQDLGYGVTQEPIAFVYNRRFIPDARMPHTHAGLRDLLARNPERFRGKVAMYNPAQSEVGMLLMSQDVQVTRDSWNLFDTLGLVDAQLYSTSRDMLQAVLSGRQWIGYDVVASYAMEMRKTHPELGVVYPSDYVLMLSRVAFISATARDPNAAKLFLDFLLSREGQQKLKSYGMGPVRPDIGVPVAQARINAGRVQAIRIGPGLLADLDSLVRAQFLRRWQQARDTAE